MALCQGRGTGWTAGRGRWWPWCLYVYAHVLLICCSVDGHLVCFLLLAVVSHAAVNMGERHISSGSCFILGEHLEVGLQDLVVILF